MMQKILQIKITVGTFLPMVGRICDVKLQIQLNLIKTWRFDVSH